MSILEHGLSTTLLATICQTCGEQYESAIEGTPCPNCNSPRRRLPSSRLYNLALVSSLVASTIGIWLLLAWPRSFEMMAYSPTVFEENLSISLEGNVTSDKPDASGATSPSITESSQNTAIQSPASTDQASTPTGQLPTLTPEPAKRKYIVQSGDTLVGIASRFDVTTEAILSTNSLPDPDRLQLDMELIIP